MGKRPGRVGILRPGHSGLSGGGGTVGRWGMPSHHEKAWVEEGRESWWGDDIMTRVGTELVGIQGFNGIGNDLNFQLEGLFLN